MHDKIYQHKKELKIKLKEEQKKNKKNEIEMYKEKNTK